MYQDLALYIDGEFIGEATGASRMSSTRRPQEVLGKLPTPNPRADLELARWQLAQRAFESVEKERRRWSAPRHPAPRGEKTDPHACQKIGRDITLDQGKPAGRSRGRSE